MYDIFEYILSFLTIIWDNIIYLGRTVASNNTATSFTDLADNIGQLAAIEFTNPFATAYSEIYGGSTFLTEIFGYLTNAVNTIIGFMSSLITSLLSLITGGNPVPNPLIIVIIILCAFGGVWLIINIIGNISRTIKDILNPLN